MADHQPIIPRDRFLLIIGAMKCGTTSLFDHLAQHPAICASAVKEPEYFSGFQPSAPVPPSYEALWDFDPMRHRWAMEASTGYTRSIRADAPGAIRDYGLRPRLVYVVREPFARIESHYNMMTQISSRWSDRIDDRHLVDTSRYFMHAERFTAVFGREALLVMRFEDLVRGDRAAFARLFDFLEIAPMAITPELPRRNVTAEIPSPARRRLHQVIPHHWRRRVPPALKTPVRVLDHVLKRTGKAKLTAAQRERIKELLADDMRALHEVYGIDTTAWGFAA
jgi:hypothetical protein